MLGLTTGAPYASGNLEPEMEDRRVVRLSRATSLETHCGAESWSCQDAFRNLGWSPSERAERLSVNCPLGVSDVEPVPHIVRHAGELGALSEGLP